jgi:methylase of polypeptide subunit release factors
MRKLERALLGIFGITTYSLCHHTGTEQFRDAGITLSCHAGDLLDDDSSLTKALLPSGQPGHLHVLELGTGCGMVGITIAQLIAGADVRLTDLEEAQEIVERNISIARPAKGSSLRFQTLDWDAELPLNLKSSSSPLDLVIAADCTYNPDSR